MIEKIKNSSKLLIKTGVADLVPMAQVVRYVEVEALVHLLVSKEVASLVDAAEEVPYFVEAAEVPDMNMANMRRSRKTILLEYPFIHFQVEQKPREVLHCMLDLFQGEVHGQLLLKQR